MAGDYKETVSSILLRPAMYNSEWFRQHAQKLYKPNMDNNTSMEREVGTMFHPKIRSYLWLVASGRDQVNFQVVAPLS